MTDAELLMYHAARQIWYVRNELTPSRRHTWAQWFEKFYGEPYMEYTSRMRKKKAA